MSSIFSKIELLTLPRESTSSLKVTYSPSERTSSPKITNIQIVMSIHHIEQLLCPGVGLINPAPGLHQTSRDDTLYQSLLD